MSDHRKRRRGAALAPTTSLVGAAPTLGIKTIFRRFWPETKSFRGRLFLSLLLVMVSPVLDTATIWLFKLLIDHVLAPADFTFFPIIAAAYIGITILSGIVSYANDCLSAWLGERFLLNMRTKVFKHLHGLSLGFFERRQLGDVLSRLTGDIAAIEALVLSGVAQTLSYTLKIILFTGMLFYLDWVLALAALVALPGFLVATRYFSKRIKQAAREKRRRSGAISAVAEESLSNVALVHAYNRQSSEAVRFHDENRGSFHAQMRAMRLQAMFRPLISLFEIIAVLLVIGLSVWELAQQRITLGGLLVFVAYVTQLYRPVKGFGRMFNTAHAASAGAERIIEVLDEKPTVREPQDPRPLARATGALAMEHVSFSYPGSEQPALSDVSLRVAPGQKVAIVGASGAGKSTLAKLLLRFYDPDDGRLTLDGIDIRDVALDDLRNNLAAVLQETLVFDGTIRENIRWGKPDADVREIVRAAVAADADEFISALPDGYDTRVGQRGRMLSGGQLQRLAIARAMIRDAPVLLLDEPTTGLDAASTQRIMDPLRRLMSGRTTIIISHNLLTVADADQILYLDGGRITGAGTHRQMLATHPGYARLYYLHHDQNSNGQDSNGRGNGTHPAGPTQPPRWHPAPNGRHPAPNGRQRHPAPNGRRPSVVVQKGPPGLRHPG